MGERLDTHYAEQKLVDRAISSHVGNDEEMDIDKWNTFLDAAARLRDKGDRGIEAVVDLFQRGDVSRREIATELLGRMSFEAKEEIRERCWRELEKCLKAEQIGEANAEVLTSIAYGMGHLQDIRTLPSMMTLSTHRDENVRFTVATQLPGCSNWELNVEVIEVLVRLARDTSARVRDWSCFGIGQLGADTPEVRGVLIERLDDDDPDTRCEALVALARTGDPCAFERVEYRLASKNTPLFKLEIDAAAELADARLHRKLCEFAEELESDSDFGEIKPSLEFAIMRTDPARIQAASEVERRVVSDLQLQVGSGMYVQTVEKYPRTRLVGTNSLSGREALSIRLWDHGEDPLNFNHRQAVDSYVLTLST
jgi:hypothetical protein